MKTSTKRPSDALEPRMFDVSDERKAQAFEWLREQAIEGKPCWRSAAIMLEELVHAKAALSASAQLPEAPRSANAPQPVAWRWREGPNDDWIYTEKPMLWQDTPSEPLYVAIDRTAKP